MAGGSSVVTGLGGESLRRRPRSRSGDCASHTTNTALTVIGEIGLDRSRWPTEKHFASWLALCPDHRESAGRRKSSRTRPSSNRAAATDLRMAAQALHRSQTALGAYLRRMKAALGAPNVITATEPLSRRR